MYELTINPVDFGRGRVYTRTPFVPLEGQRITVHQGRTGQDRSFLIVGHAQVVITESLDGSETDPEVEIIVTGVEG